ncbi:uncharacterized protein SPAPADRAFT_62993 [Spathaspora passalidarum NRRL Y-27907]|uniref:Dolichyl-diphosphooligosaccharide-protein glycosyltransferase subunit OST5 n=1 Tax=Spathaspora passalidarum (strain NRRL Y-27907 / 11-Y1) TaxID=619300 RepID=G3ASF0_SPAPN|nr:uncharacterized protein SPAPADRAFT_62993 [Spathaspora passalidarum NRRL Y-27907]EGW31068.1 hypothetical protein SPAPADRAFT_62993 [Spathaspora passalidarum NRRL Y-27907]
MSQLHITTRSPSGAPFEEYIQLFSQESSPVQLHAVTTNTTIFTAVLILIAFGSLSLIFLGDVKNKGLVNYVLNSLVASLAVGLSSIYISNFVGVYI